MCNERYNSIEFCRKNYTENGKVNEEQRLKDISEMLRILIKNEYMCKIFDDGYTTVIEYNYQDEAMSGVTLDWLDETEYIATYSDDDDDEEVTECIFHSIHPDSEEDKECRCENCEKGEKNESNY